MSISPEKMIELQAKTREAFTKKTESQLSTHPLVELGNQKKITNEDLLTLQELGPDYYALLANLDEATIATLFYQYGVRLEELRKNTQRQLSFAEFLTKITGDESGQTLPLATARLAESTINSEKQLLLSLEQTWDLFTSRLFPLLSKAEIAKMKNAHVVVIGASTGSVIAHLLAQYGIGSITIIDPDTIEQSNLNRIAGATQKDIGINKAVFAAQQLVWLQPDMKVSAYTEVLSAEELRNIFHSADAVVEMIDNLAAKVEVRTVAKQLAAEGQDDLMVWMATNVDTPQITFEGLGDPLFLSDEITPKILEHMLNPTGPQDFIRGIVAISGKEDIPVRQMVNLLLIAYGELHYLAQQGVSAAGAGWALVYLIQRHICGGNMTEKKKVLSVDTMIDSDSMEQLDKLYFIELQHTYPHLFGEFASANEAVDSLLARLLS